MEIINSTDEDIAAIFQLYEEGTAYQKKVAEKHWKGFERELVEAEIREQRQWKIVIGGEIACVFVLAFSDPFIWKEKDQDPAVYIHRIATHSAFRGRHLVEHIVEWAKKYALEHGKCFIRMDTGSGNEKLNNYYVRCGFTYLGVAEIENAADLPAHYKDGASSLFEIKVCLVG